MKLMKLMAIVPAFLISAMSAFAQIPAADVENSKSEIISTASLVDGETPMIISFWSTTCKPCIRELDAINELRREGYPLLEAIHEAGRRRLRPIMMTSLTTIFGMVPLLFSFDLGSELQKPLSIAMISAMLIGTAVSLFVVPLVYWTIYKKKDATRTAT